MLKKLKLKFVVINMTIVTLILSGIFWMLYYSTSQSLKQESVRMLESLTFSTAKPGFPDDRHNPDHIPLPYLRLLADSEGNLLESESNFYDISDSDQLQTLVSEVYSANADIDVLTKYNLRFLRQESPMGTDIVFADTTAERSMLKNLVRALAMIGAAAFLIFLAISIFLANWAVKPVALAWKQQKQFVADASHELKTPLTVILTDAELLQSSDCPEKDRQMLVSGILSMSHQMRGLVENLLDLARMDNETVKETFAHLSFSEIVSETAMTFEPVFFEKGMSLRYEIEPEISVNGIASHLGQLTSILLDNASKYASPEGETLLKLSQSGHKHCILEVSNQGEAISEEDLRNLFKRFYRADKVRSMNHSYGLGLSIAQGITEEHRGKIWCESRDGWNRFYVEIPRI